MSHPLRFRLFVFCLVAAVAAICFVAAPGPVSRADKPAPSVAIYHPDPNHLWNRLHEALFVRVGPDGRTYGRDRFEPLLWLGSRHLLQGPSHDRAVQLLKEFLNNKGEQLVEDPLKRALLQRDLWMVLSWLNGMHVGIPAEQLGVIAFEKSWIAEIGQS